MKRFLLLLLWGPLLASTSCPRPEVPAVFFPDSRPVVVMDRCGDLLIRGEIKSDIRTHSQTRDGIKDIGPDSLHPHIPLNPAAVRVTILFDYRAYCTWASIRTQYENAAGAFNGSCNQICIDRAYAGVRIADFDHSTIDIEVGRRKLNFVFDSRIQFSSFMDGILLKYHGASERYGDCFFYGGPFIVEQLNNHYAMVLESGFYEIFRTGAFQKYAVVFWNWHHYSDPLLQDRYRFVVHQFLSGYRFEPTRRTQGVTIYGAFLFNSAAKRTLIINNHLGNKAWYAGVSYGSTKRSGDWSFDFIYEYVQPQAIPDFDFGGIAKVNPTRTGLYETASHQPTTHATAIGNGNFQGFRMELIYMVTDHIAISQTAHLLTSLPFLALQFKNKLYKIEFNYLF